MAQPKPCNTEQMMLSLGNRCNAMAAAVQRITPANACLIVSDASNEGFLACSNKSNVLIGV
jgi:hypothetical protein